MLWCGRRLCRAAVNEMDRCARPLIAAAVLLFNAAESNILMPCLPAPPIAQLPVPPNAGAEPVPEAAGGRRFGGCAEYQDGRCLPCCV